MEKFDLHIHSNMSDGTFDPEAIPALAKAQGVCYMALTDHDTAAGCKRAIAAGQSIGVKVIPGIELDVEFPTELHMLGLNINPDSHGEIRSMAGGEQAPAQQGHTGQAQRIWHTG